MEKMMTTTGLCHLLILCFLVGMVSGDQWPSKDAKDVAKWVENAPFAKQKVTHVHFYFNDMIRGKNPTSMLIAQSSISNTSATVFGELVMADDPLTVGPSINTTTIGYARGLYGSADMAEFGLVMAMNFVFTAGKFNGSSLSMVGHNPTMVSPREMPILGGTGVFRMARGVAIANTYSFNFTTSYAIVEYNISILHY